MLPGRQQEQERQAELHQRKSLQLVWPLPQPALLVVCFGHCWKQHLQLLLPPVAVVARSAVAVVAVSWALLTYGEPC